MMRCLMEGSIMEEGIIEEVSTGGITQEVSWRSMMKETRSRVSQKAYNNGMQGLPRTLVGITTPA